MAALVSGGRGCVICYLLCSFLRLRTQMSALLAKTRTQRQQDLVALVARLMLLAPGQVAQQGIPID